MTLLSAPLYDKEFLRREVPLAAVCHALGIRLDETGYALCPLHDDTTPSFNLWQAADGTDRWGCFPCGLNGDAFDLVRRVHGCSFGESIRFVAELVGLAAPRVTARRRVELDEDSLKAYVSAAQRRAGEPESAGLLCVAAGLRDERLTLAERCHVDSVLREWGFGVDDRANVVIPHYRPDSTLAGAKVRSLSGVKWSFPGSRYDHLYGSWRPNLGGWDACLLCEGESDAMHAVLSDAPAHVLAVPSGAGFREDWVKQVTSFKTVYLAFDGDAAGDRATRDWTQGLATISTTVMTIQVPRDEDLRSCGVPVQTLMDRAVDADR